MKPVTTEAEEMEKVNPTLVFQQLTDSQTGDDIKLEAIRTLKKSFEKNLGNVRLKSLLSQADYFQSQFAGLLKEDLLVRYGNSVVDYLGRDGSLDGNLLRQLESILMELDKRNVQIPATLMACTWQRLEQIPTFDVALVTRLVTLSKTDFEAVVLTFLKNLTIPDYYVRMSAESPKIFRTIATILNEVLIRTEGHENVAAFVQSFVRSTAEACEQHGRNFLGLYPRDCTRLVSLLLISPDLYSPDSDKSVNRNLVLSLIYDMYIMNRRRTLLLLSHYPDWLLPFQIYLEENSMGLL